ncbi:hypothetical protein CLV98_11411 [Dyadobacter jejuensis]|uniref:ATPase n=1 Tax=Dyadobacter jejuensis TaxID=1082580 RepID=A0A316AC05_9BACT|nr:DUF4175 family protein [Dyadobacter jejuensis]PWJ55243.1 hypothetical protein CLV98_11411 [Dyadobacter jejuensis]
MATDNTGMGGLLGRIQEYRQKYYQNRLLKGLIWSVALLLTAYLFVNTLEYYGRFNSYIRGSLLFGFLGVLAFCIFQWVIQPLIHLWGIKQPLSDEDAALQIGRHFPDIGDKLLNTLQLQHITGTQTDLIEASIRQKSNQLLIVKFSDAIHFNENKKWLKYTLYPLGAIAAILLFNPTFFTTSSDRIIHFQKNFTYAPFTFKIENKELKAFKNEDFDLQLTLEGEALPQAVYILQNGSRFKLNKVDELRYSYQFKNVQRDIPFSLEAAGFTSDDYTLQVLAKPSLLSFDVRLQYPAYLKKPSESLKNVGNLTIPEGTQIEWTFNTAETGDLALKLQGDSTLYRAQQIESGGFRIKQKAVKSTAYQMLLTNDDAHIPEPISYAIQVIPDQYPSLTLENFQDTTLYNYFVLGGTIGDDYGFSNLKLHYALQRKDEKAASPNKSIPIPFNNGVNNQSFFFQWYVDSLQLAAGDRITYFVQVSDNDGVNGPKSTRSRSVQFTVPSKDELAADLKKSEEATQQRMQSALQKAQSLEKDLKKIDDRLKRNKEFDFKEQKQMEDLLKKREELIQELKDLQEQNKSTFEKARQFNQQSPELQEKIEKLQKLMDDLLDKDTEKLYEELKKLLENKQSERLNSTLEKLRNKEQNLEKELERTMKLFKQMQLEQKVEQLAEKLEELAEQEEQLSDKTQENGKQQQGTQKDQEQQNLSKQQQEIKEEYEKAQESIKEIESLGEEIDQPVDTQKESQKEASESLQESQKQLGQKNSSKASQSMKKAAKAMKQTAQAMSASMESMEMEQMQEDLDALRDILENLITLSFDQEQLMKDFRGVSLQDPRFVKLGQQQLKLQDDAKVVEDSLYALANRVLQIQTFVTRELNDMKGYMDGSMTNIRERHLPVATAQQQAAMTSMNNLALMLSDVLNQMQEQMAMAMPGAGKGKKGKQKSQQPGIGEQQEKLNGQMKQLGSGQEGQGNQSEQLARMAAEQARIRQMVQDLINAQKGTPGGQQLKKELQEIADKMDQTETDLVNKRIGPDLIKRNQEIKTRLLESEKAMKEQDEDQQRKAQAARQLPRKPPAAFEKFIKEKEKQTELLRTIPPTFSPYYKKEVDQYFKKYESVN